MKVTTIKLLKHEKRGILAMMRKARADRKAIYKRIQAFKRSLKRTPKNEMELYLDNITRMAVEIDGSYAKLRDMK